MPLHMHTHTRDLSVFDRELCMEGWGWRKRRRKGPAAAAAAVAICELDDERLASALVSA